MKTETVSAHSQLRSSFAKVLIVPAALIFGSCVTSNSYPGPHKTPIPPAFVEAGSTSSRVAGDGWVNDFRDPVLSSLVREAWSHNPDLYSAAGVYQEAVAAARGAASTLFPELNGKASSRLTDNSGTSMRDYNAGLEVSWEVDLWGRLKSDRAFAQKLAQSAGLDYLQARHSLAAAVAEAYFAVISAEEQLSIDRLLLSSERETAKITGERVDAGLGSAVERNLGNANVNLAEANIRSDEAALREAKRSLEILLGRYPAASIAKGRSSLPGLPGRVATGVPSSLLERRPDVRSAELVVDAAYENVKSARAARLPRLVLSAGSSNLISPSDFISQVAAGITAPIFTGGRLEAQEQIATARQRQALGNFASISLKAFREVESSLSNARFLAEQERELAVASTRLREASKGAEGRYDQGVIQILDLQQIRSRDYQTRSQLLGVRFEQLRQRLALYRALGGEVFSESDAQWKSALEKEFNQR